MTTVCMVVHAEGPGELGGTTREAYPGRSLMTEEHGPAHILVQRVLSEGTQIPEQAIDFREPFRTQTGAPAYGSKLLDSRVLDEILIGWLLEPLLIVLIIDSDEAKPNEREAILQEALDRNGLQGAVGVAVKEFESWLIADAAALSRVLGHPQKQISKVEALPCAKAKRLLNQWSQDSVTAYRSTADIRKDLALAIDLDLVSKACPSFQKFRQALLAMKTN